MARLLGPVFRRTLRDSRKGIFWWSLGTFALVLFIVGLYPSLQDMKQLNEFYHSSKEIVALVGTQDITSPVGFLTQEIFSIMAPLFLIIYGINLGTAAIAREEDRGTLPLLLANPVSRFRVLSDKYAAMKVALLVVAAVLWLSIAALGPVFGMHDLDLLKLAAACLMTFLIGLAFGSIAFLVGAVTGNRGLATGVASALGLGMYLLYVMERLVDSLEPYRWLSLFYYFHPDTVLSDLPTVGDLLVLAGVAVVTYALSAAVFRRRDISA